jgi:hypothetical protein
MRRKRFTSQSAIVYFRRTGDKTLVVRQEEKRNMPIPDLQTVMMPLMQHCRDGQEHAITDTVESLAESFKLTDASCDCRKTMILVFLNDVHMALMDEHRIARFRAHYSAVKLKLLEPGQSKNDGSRTKKSMERLRRP